MNQKSFRGLILTICAYLATHYTATQQNNYNNDCAATTQDDCPSFYLRAEGGASFARCADIKVDLTVWDPAKEGYNSPLGTAPLVGFGFGYNINNWLSAGVSAACRNKFKYCKNQTTLGVTTPGAIGDKTRFFNLDTTSYMFDIFINRAYSNALWHYNLDALSFAPYAGIGLGFSHTTVYNFHTVEQQTITVGTFTTHPVQSIMTHSSHHAFSWQAQFGLDISWCQWINLSLGYRYFDAGKFFSNNYITSISTGFTTPVTLSKWSGKLRAHEVVAGLTLEF